MLSVFLSTMFSTSSLFCDIDANLLANSVFSVNQYINSLCMIAKCPHFRNLGTSNKIHNFQFPLYNH